MTAIGEVIQPGQSEPDPSSASDRTDRYMMATKAVHALGDISRDEPALAIIYGEDGTDFIGEWATGFGYVNVRFPKATTRELTAEERREYHGKFLDVAGAVRPIVIDEPAAAPLTVTAVREPEPQPEKVDVLDLVRQHGQAWHDVASGVFDDNVEGAEVGSRIATANALFARIEAEVQQLRAERDDLQKLFEMQYDRTAKAVEIWRAEAPEERAQVLLPDFGELVTWLLRRVGDQGREHLALSAEIDHYRNAARDLRVQLDAARAPKQDDPLVLSLPTVPEGAVALIGAATGRRFKRTMTGAWQDEQTAQVMPIWRVLEREGSVTVVMREPRTWPKLDAPEDNPQLRGASGAVYRYSHRVEGVPLYREGPATRLMSIFAIQAIDGPLTEVFDDGGEPA